MATRDTGQPGQGITRRGFIKATAAATAVAGCGLDFVYDPSKALAYENKPGKYKVTVTTCPYCSASCGQRVVTDITPGSATQGEVVDIYGDFESPMNSGGLCAKGAGSLQLVKNERRIGAWTADTTSVFVAKSGAWVNADDPVPAGWPGTETTFAGKNYTTDGVAYFREGNDAWKRVPLDLAMKYGAEKMIAARDIDYGSGGAPAASNFYNKKNVAFFGSSHLNNEPNWLYRKIIANFGTSNVEHQARI